MRIHERPEFLLTCRYIDRYIKPGDRVLDIGGGPGRYSIYLAEKGCDVTLFDLSEGNLEFALAKAEEHNVSLKALRGDARCADELLRDEQFDHIPLMGPLYHLLEESDRIRAVEAALNLLRPGGVIFVSFIALFAGIIYYMKIAPEAIISQDPVDINICKCVLNEKNYCGDLFTRVFLIEQNNILPFMAQFPLKKLHLISQEGILSPCESNIFSASPEARAAWLDLAESLCERQDFLSWAEHLMYIGRGGCGNAKDALEAF